LRLSKAWIVAEKDLDEFKRNRFVMTTLVSMPIILSLTPILSFLTPMLIYPGAIGDAEKLSLILMLPRFTLPLLIMIPTITPSMIASYSFVGEKTNRSLEPLLATPTSEEELLVGKSFAVFMPTMIGTWVGFIIDMALLDWVAYPLFGHLIVPDLSWAMAMLLLSPSFCILSIEANVLVSSRMNDIRAAQQIGGMVVMPVMLICFGSLTNFFPLASGNMLIIFSIALMTVLLLGSITKKVFQREEILTKWR
jgi:ABC-2 type transport system permease protein